MGVEYDDPPFDVEFDDVDFEPHDEYRRLPARCHYAATRANPLPRRKTKIAALAELFSIGAPRFELGTSSPPDFFAGLAGGPAKWSEVASAAGFEHPPGPPTRLVAWLVGERWAGPLPSPRLPIALRTVQIPTQSGGASRQSATESRSQRMTVATAFV
jgi:hypothetical protein